MGTLFKFGTAPGDRPSDQQIETLDSTNVAKHSFDAQISSRKNKAKVGAK
jgi:hypothetical protein